MTAKQRQRSQKRLSQYKAKAKSARDANSSKCLSNTGDLCMSRLDDAVHFHQTALGLQSQRQAVIASNIANADTPNYKARDMNFGAALSGALQGRVGQPLALATTTAKHIPVSGMAMAPALQYRPESQSSVDGNTVDMDSERSAMAENTLHYEASVTFINGLLKSMQQAVSGQT